MHRVHVNQVEDHMKKWCENNSKYWYITSISGPPWDACEFWFNDEDDKLMFILKCL